MTRGIGWFVLAVALVAVLIPYPGLIWVSLAGLALIWFATPTSKPHRRAARHKKGAGS